MTRDINASEHPYNGLDSRSFVKKTGFLRFALSHLFLASTAESAARAEERIKSDNPSPVGRNEEQEPNMSTPAPAVDQDESKKKRAMLEALVNQARTVEVSRDSILDDAKDFQKAFANRATGLSGFQASFTPPKE
jgi:hypothetical protein